MSGYITNIEERTLDNDNFREVLFSTPKSQLVVMSLLPNEDIGEEVHDDVDQFIRVERGRGVMILDGDETRVEDGSAIVIPAGTRHNLINQSGDKLKLYTIYTPAEHRDGTIHKTKADAQADTSDHY